MSLRRRSRSVRGGRRRRVQTFEVEARDCLGPVVFGHRKVVARQIADDRAALVAHDDVDEHELGAGAKHRALLRSRRWGREQRDDHGYYEGSKTTKDTNLLFQKESSCSS